MRKEDIKDLRLLKCGFGEEWRKSAGQNIRQMKIGNDWIRKIPHTHNKTRQKKWIGHTLRGESLLKMVIEGKMLRKRSKGRPRQMMLDWIMMVGQGWVFLPWQKVFL